MTIKEQFAKWFIARYLPNHHLSWNPGKHPLTRMKLNGAVSANLDKFEKGGKDSGTFEACN